MIKGYNHAREQRSRLVLEAQVRAVGITLAVLLVIVIYSKLANYILPQ